MNSKPKASHIVAILPLIPGAEEHARDLGVFAELLARAGVAVAAVDEDVTAIGDTQRLLGVLLDHQHRHAVVLD